MNEEPQQPSEPRPPEPSAPQPDFSQPPRYGQQPYPPGYSQPPSVIDRIIPAKNVKALLAYYFGVFSLVPCFTPLLGPAALVLGILGLNDCKRDPNLPGKGHAITGIVLGSLTTLIAVALVLIVVIFGKRS